MFSPPLLNPFFSFSGWMTRGIELNSGIVTVQLKRDVQRRTRCPHCQRAVGENRRIWQRVKDLPLGKVSKVNIMYQAVQGRCTGCRHYFTLTPGGIHHKAKATQRLISYVSKLCRYMPINKITASLPVSHSTVRRWNKKTSLQTALMPNFDKLRIILVDEFLIGSRREHVTVVINGDNGEVLHIAKGRREESLSQFFEKLTEQQIANIKAFGIVSADAYLNVIQKKAPLAIIVTDKFRLIINSSHIIKDPRRTDGRLPQQHTEPLSTVSTVIRCP